MIVLREALQHSVVIALVTTLAGLDALLGRLDPDEEFPVTELGRPRGRQGSPRRVVLPERWLDSREHVGAGPVEEVASGSGG